MTYQKNIIKEQEEMGDDGFVATDDEKTAADLAKDGVKVKLTKEQEGINFSVQETKSIAKEVGKALIGALRDAGDEIETIKVIRLQENTFDVFVKYKNEFEDEFTFDIRNDKLHLVDFSFDKELVDVGVKPSGEPIINVDVLKNELLKHFKSINETDNVNEEETDRQKYLRMLDMYKKSTGADRDKLRPKVEKAAQQVGIKLQLKEAPEGMFYLKVDIRDARQAIGILDDKYRKQVEYSGSDTYYFNDETTAYDAMMDLKANDIMIADTNLDLFAEEEKFINHPRLAVNILKDKEKELRSIYKKYYGSGQSRNPELKVEVMNLLTPEVKKLNLKEDDEEKVMNMLKRGLASLEASMLRKNIGMEEGEEKVYKGKDYKVTLEKGRNYTLKGVHQATYKENPSLSKDRAHQVAKQIHKSMNETLDERVASLQDFINLIRTRAIDSEFSEQEEALEVIEAIADHYGIKIQTGGFVGEETISVGINGKEVDIRSIEIDGVDKSQGADDGTVDAFASYAEFKDGTKLTDDELDKLTDGNPDLIHNLALDTFHESAPGYMHDCAAHVVHEIYGHGMCIPEKHTLIKEGNKYVVTHYDVVFKKDKKIVRDIPINELKVITQTEHWHKNYKKKKK